MGGFFTSYVAIGVALLLGYVIITIGIGVAFGKILNKKWVIIPILILNLTIFYLFELRISIYYLLILVITMIIAYLIKQR